MHKVLFRRIALVATIALATACETAPTGGSGGLDTLAATSDSADGANDVADAKGGTTADQDAATGADTAGVDAAACGDDKLSKLFHTKVKPLVTAGQPTTCNQCHFSGVDLGMFVQESPCKSMACMVEKGMVDFDDPAASEVLKWIAKATPASSFITKEVQQAEHDVFLEWITQSATCHQATCGAIADPCGGKSVPDPKLDKPMIGGCDEAALVATFKTKVYAYRDRCSHCHAPYGKDNASSGAPPFLSNDPSEGGAIYTMYDMIGKGYVDIANPEASLLLTKPLSPKAGGVQHGGGVKFANKNDVSYKAFLSWIEQFAACKAPK